MAMSIDKLGKRAREVFEFLQERQSYGVTPSIREICTALSIKSTSTVHRYLCQLEDAGLINRQDHANRTIQLQNQERIIHVPLLGTVTAGEPIYAYEQAEGYVPLRGTRYRPQELFALRVKGTSMINAGILDRDIVIAQRTPEVENGEIAVVLIDDFATVKRFYKEDNFYRLQPENDLMDPIYTENAHVLGRVISLYRDYE